MDSLEITTVQYSANCIGVMYGISNFLRVGGGYFRGGK